MYYSFKSIAVVLFLVGWPTALSVELPIAQGPKLSLDGAANSEVVLPQSQPDSRHFQAKSKDFEPSDNDGPGTTRGSGTRFLNPQSSNSAC